MFYHFCKEKNHFRTRTQLKITIVHEHKRD